MSEDAHWPEDLARHEMLLQHDKKHNPLIRGQKIPPKVTPRTFWVALKEFANSNCIDTVILNEPPNDFWKSKYRFIKMQEVIE